jgi:hypothetical protein
LENVLVEALQRIDRWALIGLGFFLLGSIAYAVWPRQLQPPIVGLGQPASIIRFRSSVRVTYVLDKPLREVYSDLDLRLQIKGYQKQPYSASTYAKPTEKESIALYEGIYTQDASGRLSISWNPNKTTLVQTIYTPRWWRFWRTFQRDMARRNAMKARDAASLTLVR